VGRDLATDNRPSVSGTADESETTDAADDDGLELSVDDADDSIPAKQLHEQDSSDSGTPQLGDIVVAKLDDSVDKSDKAASEDTDIIVEEMPPAKETIRDRLEKAGVKTDGSEPLLNIEVDLKV